MLPSEVRVYLSPFTDIYGSRIIFAGPHMVFSEGNKDRPNLFSHRLFNLTDMADEVEMSVQLSIEAFLPDSMRSELRNKRNYEVVLSKGKRITLLC